MRGSEANCRAQTDSTRESLSLIQVTVLACPGPGVNPCSLGKMVENRQSKSNMYNTGLIELNILKAL